MFNNIMLVSTPILFGDNLADWAVKIVLAVLAFFLITWLLPKFGAAVHLEPPPPIPTLIALAVAILVFIFVQPGLS
jgi:hypothetical protein